MKQMYGLKELGKVELVGDNLEAFLNMWMKVLNGQRNPADISSAQKEELFYVQLKKSVRMKEDIAHYRRVGPGHADHTYEYLLRCINHHIREEREDRNMIALEKSMAGGKDPLEPAAGADTICPFFKKGNCKKAMPATWSTLVARAKARVKRQKVEVERPPGRGTKAGRKGGKAKTSAESARKGTPTESSASRTPSQDATKKYPCYPFSEGRCKHQNNPEKCKFAHRELTAAEKKQRDQYKAARATSPAPPTQSEAEVCPSWLKGDCPLGKKCKNKHPKKLKGRDA